MPQGALVNIIWGISFEESWKVSKGDIIVINGSSRLIQHKEDSVVFVQPFSGSTSHIQVNFLAK